MSTSLLALGIAGILGIGLIVTVAVLSLFMGTFDTFLGRPRLKILKGLNGRTGFAFSFSKGAGTQKIHFDQIKIRLFNPFGDPTQVDVTKKFDSQEAPFSLDLSMGPGMERIFAVKNQDNASIQVEVSSAKQGVAHQYLFKAKDFFKKLDLAKDFSQEKIQVEEDKILYPQAGRSFIADPLPEGARVQRTIALPTNPEFSSFFAGGSAEGSGQSSENFSVSKVWIEPGCIVCDACEGIYPEVFHVTEKTCIVRDDYPKDNGLLVQEAADACPVEVIKFDKAN